MSTSTVESSDTKENVMIGEKIAFTLALTLGITGCQVITTSPTMYHEVDVPRRFRSGRAIAWDDSDHERYVRAYEAGWWTCVEKYVKDIDFQSIDQDKVAVGWAATVEGFLKGFEDAEARIRDNMQQFGVKQTQEYLIEIWEAR